MRATASSCPACQSSARKLSAARRVMRPNSSLYCRKCSAISAALSFAVASSWAAGAAADVTAALMCGLCRRALRPRLHCRELLGLGAAGHCTHGMCPGRDGRLHGVEIAGADEGLVLGGAVARAFLTELALLQLRVAEHAVRAIGGGQLEHRQIQRVPTGQRDELKAIAQCRQILAPPLHGRGVELGLPIEGG